MFFNMLYITLLKNCPFVKDNLCKTFSFKPHQVIPHSLCPDSRIKPRI